MQEARMPQILWCDVAPALLLNSDRVWQSGSYSSKPHVAVFPPTPISARFRSALVDSRYQAVSKMLAVDKTSCLELILVQVNAKISMKHSFV